MFLYVLPCQAGRLENGKTKSSNSRSEGEVVLLTVEGCDSSKVSPSDNQHLQPFGLLIRKERVRKGRPLKCHTSPYLTDFRLRR
ncbi:unnamed protein product [Schistosoma margrebowiei]|uniref:Uncharacterized protein n=1 Tax=Schistosoma margrebowiei TaxID=48269 RepID=A0A183L9U5_9TREM|nr:unnamed protein product [Schistosoma margrebowiei]